MSIALQEAWKELQTEVNTQETIDKEAIMEAIKIKSKNPLEGLRNGLNIKRNWCMAFGIGSIVALLASFNYPQAIIIWCISIAYYFWGYWSITKQLERLDTSLDMPIKPLLESYHKRVSDSLASEEGAGAFSLPMSAVIGFSLVGIYKGTSLQQMFTDPVGLTILVVATILLGTLGLLAAKRMNKIAFGKYLEQLKTNIDLLNSNDIG